jgi:hypothetical protein
MTDQFNKKFSITIEQLENLLNNPTKSVPINRELTSPENIKLGIEKLKTLLLKSNQ